MVLSPSVSIIRNQRSKQFTSIVWNVVTTFVIYSKLLLRTNDESFLVFVSESTSIIIVVSSL